MKGWFRESYRHHLAGRGISSSHRLRYFAKTSAIGFVRPEAVVVPARTFQEEKPESDRSSEELLAELGALPGQVKPSTVYSKVAGGRTLRRALGREILEKRPLIQYLEDIDAGDWMSAVNLIEYETKGGQPLATEAEKAAIRAKLGEYAVRAADAGLEVPDALYEKLSPDTKKRVDSLKVLKARELESPFKTLAREEGAKVAVGVARGVAAAPGALAGGLVEAEAAGLRAFAPGKLTEEKEFKGPLAQEDDLQASPWFDKTTNFFIGEEPSPLSMVLSQPGFQDKPKTRPSFQELVQRKVDSLAMNREKLAAVDLSSFEKGKDAFKKGDREKLVEHIAELQSQEAKEKDRWDMLGQTMAQMKSAENHESLFEEPEGPFSSIFGGRGGDRLADQTEKLSDVRGEILKAANEVHARRSSLENDLKRLDSVVPPDTSAPRGRVKVFSSQSPRAAGRMDMDIDNPLGVGKIDNPLSVRKIQNPLDSLTVRNPVV